MTITTLHGDCRLVLPTLPERSVQMCVTSPPYYGLRKYSDDPREIGQELIPDCLAWARAEPACGQCYVCALRAVFVGVWRVLRDDGTLWLNLGDSYNSSPSNQQNGNMPRNNPGMDCRRGAFASQGRQKRTIPNLPEKSLLGIPWRVALALQADGWILRNDNIWAKTNCMPESVQDRCTRAHEYVFMFAKSQRYFYDADAIREPHARLWNETNGGNLADIGHKKNGKIETEQTHPKGYPMPNPAGRNHRTVWTIDEPVYKLRDDLTPDQRAHAIAVLMERGLL